MDEDRRADARIESGIARAMKEGRAGTCEGCGDFTSRNKRDEVGEPIGWQCRYCAEAEREESCG